MYNVRAAVYNYTVVRTADYEFPSAAQLKEGEPKSVLRHTAFAMEWSSLRNATEYAVSIYAEDVELPEGEYFDVELEGCTVLDDATGEELGKLKRVLHYPAHKVYEVKGAREYLIPAVPGVFIASVDIDAGVVRIHNMKGLAIDEN